MASPTDFIGTMEVGSERGVYAQAGARTAVYPNLENDPDRGEASSTR